MRQALVWAKAINGIVSQTRPDGHPARPGGFKTLVEFLSLYVEGLTYFWGAYFDDSLLDKFQYIASPVNLFQLFYLVINDLNSQTKRRHLKHQTPNINMENQVFLQFHEFHCKRTEICHLVSFPEPGIHQQAYSAKSIQLRPFLPLIPGTYNATQLAYETVKDFAEGLVHGYQRSARDNFLTYYIQAALRADVFRAWQQNALQQRRRFPLSVDELAAAAILDNYLHDLMKCLDDCFFFGTLTRVHQGHQAPCVQLSTGYHVLRDEAGIKYGETISKGNSSHIKVWTLTASSLCAETVPWSTIVSTLMHEMTHAYLNTFVCNGEQCTRNSINTVGLSGHGNTFLKVHALILQQMRSWHTVLADMDSACSLEGGCVDGYSCAIENEAYRQAMLADSLRNFLPLRADSPNQLLRLVQGEVNGRTITMVLFRRRGSPIPHPDAWIVRYLCC
ncbi:hypothetical protein CCHR01_19449 [Colletotrichum chrysophilum]|uniref:SprT-like domain-containing protein n=1 Tax=Colletotrichum chrysophilum TaxID=1836956 RepID=A0AAD8ZZN8_9PEZI|nr:hypothetical protein CCHR01_19449 [Colletotrichum chrysophilum]